MREHDIERAVDTALSGLRTSPARREQLRRIAMDGSRSAADRRNDRVRLKLRFSLSFGLSHMIVAAAVAALVILAPLFIPGQKDVLDTWQSRDEEYYMVQGHEGSGEQAAEAAERPPEPGVFSVATVEEARQHYGAGMPVLTWLPDDAAAVEHTVSVTEVSRGLMVFHVRDGGIIIYQATEFYLASSVYTYISQDGEGEYIPLADGRELYLTTNSGRMTAAWQEGLMEFLLAGDFTREEAIRMAESIGKQ